uniref:FAST kinase domain-containing protein 2 n=1 Tax=Phallusia mammillata TaxID=59560 RepID=A0A6F9DD80_9ASCI|nr:FAST kinase domain-containing protein 2 [Phallusia mammillata]
MLHLAKSPVLSQASKSWKLMFSEVFCCQVRPDPLFAASHNQGYQTFGAKQPDETQGNDNESVIDNRKDSSERAVVTSPSRPTTLVGISCHSPATPLAQAKQTILSQPSAVDIRSPLLTSKSPLKTTVCNLSNSPVKESTKSKSPEVEEKTKVEDDAITPPSELLSQCSTSGISSGIMSAPSSMEFSEDTLDGKQEESYKKDDVEVGKETEVETKKIVEEPPKLKRPSVLGPLKVETYTEEELLKSVVECVEPTDVMVHISLYQNRVTPLLAVACIHQILLKALAKFPRNSPQYNSLCGEVLTNRIFRELISLIEDNAKTLNNFSLLTISSDLLYLRLTLKKPTISTLLSYVDFESMNLDELRLLAMCLHTPNIPLINSEYMYNVSASVATRYIDHITDLYTLLNIMKCFGRYFTKATKRQCESRVACFCGDLKERYPDGRIMAAHMFDAFYRMEHAPMRQLLQQGSNAIVHGDIPLQPQDVSAILRYFVKFGYTIDGNELLDKLSNAIFERLPHELASQFTTNIKWLTVFYYYNEELLDVFVDKVMKHISVLDFVALSDVLDALAQVYYVPKNGDEFFDCIYSNMLDKLPTLNTSHVHNAGRKLVLTAYHFAVFGRYPKELLEIALNKQFTNPRSGSRFFMRDLCKAVSIERPDLLPSWIPEDFIMDLTAPKTYAFEKSVQNVLETVAGGKQYFSFIASPLRSFPLFLLRARLDGSLLPTQPHPTFIPPHMHQQVQNIAVVPLPRSRFCIGSQHATGKTRLVLRLLRAQGARVVTIPHFNWDGLPNNKQAKILKSKIFDQKTDDVIQ